MAEMGTVAYGRIYSSEVYQAKYDIQGSFRPIQLIKTIAATFLIVRFWSSYSKIAIFIVKKPMDPRKSDFIV